ncbi:P-selectin-like isoform X1 [Scyliorhinus canicula]|uniref:P-selectin-like isoform X1 n=1 Tax=Scyliorhinus canicula TaxID=7830 RepID=UPI0018F3F921|nr:P-selectin-like isoform X1 [Scyliorhinus canicula]
MVSHDGMICPCSRWPQMQGYIFRFLVLVVVICESLILQGVLGWTYHYQNRTMTWNRTRRFCKNNYTDMVAIQNMEENKYLDEYLPKTGTHVWIGLRKIQNNWTWIGTNRVLEDFVKNWAPGEPNNGRNNEDCVEMYIKRISHTGQWNDESCRKKKRPLCYKASCYPDSCSGHGECVETIGYYKCNCHEGFYGDNCEKVIKCMELEAPDRGLMNCSHPYGNFSYNSLCNFNCVEGYEIREKKTLKCTASADWTDPLPQCKVKQCMWLEVPSKDVMKCFGPFGRFNYNSTCTFGCREGYVVHGSDRVQCLASGQWTDRTPTCKVQVCETLTLPDHGNMSCTHPIADFHYNSTCDFSCNEGFTLSGLSRIQCKVSGQWTAPKPTCEAVKCSELKIPHGLLTNCSDPFGPFSYSSRCDFVCKAGFILQGSERLYCEASGKWTSKTPICKAVQCNLLKIPNQGIMQCRSPFGDFNYNSSCAFSCNEGFVLQGSGNLQCQASGEWTAQVPSCEAAKCARLENPEKGNVSCSHSFGRFSYNTTCNFSCEEGFTLNGSDSVQCGASGQWTKQIPSCEAKKCETLTQPEHGAMNCSHPIGNFSYTSTCGFWCPEGFVLSGTNWLECGTSGQWTAKTPTCKVKQCETLTQPEHGAMNCSHPIGNFSYTSTCGFWCPEGFVLSGTNWLDCGTSGQWTAKTPTCKVKKCETLTQPEHGAMNCSHPIGDFSYTSTCGFWCPEGFVLSGTNWLECGTSGQWTAKTPTCKVKKCETLTQPEHGAMNCSHPIGNFSYTSTCGFWCPEGFLLSGTNWLECGTSGQWTAKTPTCKVKKCETLTQPEHGTMNCSNPIGNFSYTSTCGFWCPEGFVLSGTNWLECGTSGQWTAKTPTCKVKKCETLTQPEHGAMNCSNPIGNFSYTSTCGFWCPEGFVLSGTNWLECGTSGQWTAKTPTCKVRKCETLTQPEHGAMNCSHPIGNFSYTSTCGFWCPEGFVLSGTNWLECGTSGQWTAKTPTCKAKKCETLTQPEHGAMNCSHPIGNFSYTSTCGFWCPEGFVLSGTNWLECGTSGQWTAKTPTCKVKKCETLTQPEHGAMNCSHPIGNFSYTSTCGFWCPEGFVLSGTNWLECGTSGQWTAKTPTCKSVACQTLTQPERGVMSCTHPLGNFSYISTCEFSCDEGFALTGSGRLQCQTNGEWTTHTPSCKVVTCQTLKQPEQGAMNCSRPIGDFSFNSVCDFNCKEGFVLRGSESIQCQANKEWTAHTPNCKAVRCNILRSLHHGRMSCSHPIGEFSYRSVCNLSCVEEGFILTGADKLECTASGKWTDEMPACEVVKCQQLKAAHSQIMNCSHHLGNFSYGSICDFHCVKGLKLNGPVRLQCNESGQWTDQIPSCDVLRSLPPAAASQIYPGAIAAAVGLSLLAGMVGTIVVMIRKKLKKEESDTAILNSESIGGTEDTFDNPSFDNAAAGS